MAIHLALHWHAVAKRLVCCVLAICFLGGSTWNAIKNISASGEDSRELVSSQNLEIQRAGEDRKAWSQARKVQFDIAGDATVESIEAAIHAKQVEPGSRWNVTEGCVPEKVTAGASRTYCVDIDALRAKLAAAKKRDAYDAKIETLNASERGKGVQKAVDPGTDRIAAALGVQSEEGKKRITVSGEWGQALLQEMIAGFGPGLLFSFLMMMLPTASQEEGRPAPQKPVRKPEREKAGPPAASKEIESHKPAVPVSGPAAEIDAFVAACLEFVTGEFVPTTPMFDRWKEWCIENGVKPGSHRGFTLRIKKRVQHEPNGGHPGFKGVCFKPKGPAKLRVVA
jgi:hypothetical protein